ncbi:hypothetical protein LY78DRAFT_335629 [Colletotrichum sublineola]|nr:hypothetical protein LY78DRAFT_335629 [Colletotrichum sublineola]
MPMSPPPPPPPAASTWMAAGAYGGVRRLCVARLHMLVSSSTTPTGFADTIYGAMYFVGIGVLYACMHVCTYIVSCMYSIWMMPFDATALLDGGNRGALRAMRLSNMGNK